MPILRIYFFSILLSLIFQAVTPFSGVCADTLLKLIPTIDDAVLEPLISSDSIKSPIALSDFEILKLENLKDEIQEFQIPFSSSALVFSCDEVLFLPTIRTSDLMLRKTLPAQLERRLTSDTLLNLHALNDQKLLQNSEVLTTALLDTSHYTSTRLYELSETFWPFSRESSQVCQFFSTDLLPFSELLYFTPIEAASIYVSFAQVFEYNARTDLALAALTRSLELHLSDSAIQLQLLILLRESNLEAADALLCEVISILQLRNDLRVSEYTRLRKVLQLLR
jgi:hypothetical protein